MSTSLSATHNISAKSQVLDKGDICITSSIFIQYSFATVRMMRDIKLKSVPLGLGAWNFIASVTINVAMFWIGYFRICALFFIISENLQNSPVF